MITNKHFYGYVFVLLVMLFGMGRLASTSMTITPQNLRAVTSSDHPVLKLPLPLTQLHPPLFFCYRNKHSPSIDCLHTT